MKYLLRVFLVSAFLLSITTEIAYAKKAATKAPKKTVKSKVSKDNFTYLSVAKDLKKKVKNKLSPAETMIINDFIKGKSKNYKDAKHLESAIKKHPCFVATKAGKKANNLLSIPDRKVKPDWFTLDCSKPGKDKKNGVSPKGKNQDNKKSAGSNRSTK